MNLIALGQFLFGGRGAILRIAHCPSALWVGLVFVLAAGLAREYDGEDLWHEPWHLLIPLGASVASSFILYCLVRFVAWMRKASEPDFLAGYRTFLTLYWLTAPLAFLYAIPFERFLSAGDAMAANLWLLAIVAGWRVLLITRVIAVLYRASYFAAIFPVMLFGDTLLLVIMSQMSLPLLSIMGGIRLSEADDVLLGTTLVVGFFGYLTWLVWLGGTLSVIGVRDSPWKYEVASDATCKVVPGVWALALATLGMWAFILPFTQPEQQLRRRVEQDLMANRIEEALLRMSAHELDDFPRHWVPPPRLTWPNPRPEMIVVQEIAEGLELKPWVRHIYDDKFTDLLRGDLWHLAEMPAEEVERRVRLLVRLYERHAGSGSYSDIASQMLERLPNLSEQTRAQLQELKEASVEPTAGQEKGDPAQTQGSPEVDTSER